MGDRKPTRFINKEGSNLWKVPTLRAIASFTPEELAYALNHLEPGKSPGLDYIFTKLILHAGPALKSWLCDFFISCMCQLKISRIWRRAL